MGQNNTQWVGAKLMGPGKRAILDLSVIRLGIKNFCGEGWKGYKGGDLLNKLGLATYLSTEIEKPLPELNPQTSLSGLPSPVQDGTKECNLKINFLTPPKEALQPSAVFREKQSSDARGWWKTWTTRVQNHFLGRVSLMIISSLPLPFRNQEKGGFGRGVLQNVRLSWLWLSECQIYCWGQYPWICFVSLAVTLDSTETPFAWSLIFFSFFCR